MIYRTPDEKRRLAKMLEIEDPEFLELLKLFAKHFGPLESVEYTAEWQRHDREALSNEHD